MNPTMLEALVNLQTIFHDCLSTCCYQVSNLMHIGANKTKKTISRGEGDQSTHYCITMVTCINKYHNHQCLLK